MRVQVESICTVDSPDSVVHLIAVLHYASSLCTEVCLKPSCLVQGGANRGCEVSPS